MIRLLIFSCAIALLFIGSVGVDVFKHICKKDGVTVSLFVKADHNCEENEDSHACCKQEKKKDCCNDEEAHFKINLDYFNQLHQFYFLSFDPVPQPYWIEVVEARNNQLVHHYPQPPPLAGKDILILNQVFII